MTEKAPLRACAQLSRTRLKLLIDDEQVEQEPKKKRIKKISREKNPEKGRGCSKAEGSKYKELNSFLSDLSNQNNDTDYDDEECTDEIVTMTSAENKKLDSAANDYCVDDEQDTKVCHFPVQYAHETFTVGGETESIDEEQDIYIGNEFKYLPDRENMIYSVKEIKKSLLPNHGAFISLEKILKKTERPVRNGRTVRWDSCDVELRHVKYGWYRLKNVFWGSS